MFLLGMLFGFYIMLFLFTFCFDFIAYVTGRSDVKPSFSFKFWSKKS